MKNDFTENKTADLDSKLEITEKLRILLIDDEEFLVKLWKNVLKKHSYIVTGYSNGISALNDFNANPYSFDIVITDNSMPFVTGKELAQLMVKMRNDIKIILCTGYSEDIDKENAIGMGICEFLIKPFDNATLLRTVEKVSKK